MSGALTNHLWQSTLFAIAAGLLTLALRKNRAQVRYWLWFTASLKFFVPFWLLMSLGGSIGWTPSTQRSTNPSVMPSVSFAVEQIARPFPEAVSSTTARAAANDWAPIWILSVWACGFVGVALIRFRGWLRIRAAVRSSSVMNIAAAVEVRSAPGLLEPGVVGLLRPILLLPAGIVECLTPAQLDAILAHELCHVRRRDNLLASIHMMVEAMFWFYPLVWWIGARLMEERERACDEDVLSMGNEPRDYAEGILNVCKLYVESPLVCVSGVTGSNLKQRIEEIMSNRIGLSLSYARKTALAVAAMTAVAVPIVVGIFNVPRMRAQSQGANTAKFETASIKACKDGGLEGAPARFGAKKSKSGGGSGPHASDGSLGTGCSALVYADSLGLIQRAYVRYANGGTHWAGIVSVEGGPAWIHTEAFDINATAAGNPSLEMMQGPMLQALLEDRFKLKLHRETREVPVYELTATNGGTGLKPFQEGSCVTLPLAATPPGLQPGQTFCKVMVSVRKPMVSGQGSTLDEFSKLLGLVLDRPVIDKTGIAGRFDLQLEFGIDKNTPRFLPGGDLAAMVDVASTPASPSIFQAIQQLGLKLEPSKGPKEYIVIDHVERPVEN